MTKEQLIDEMARCIADWSSGGTTTAKIDGIEYLDSEGFLCGWCGDFSLAEVLEGRTPEDVAREYVDAVWDEVDMRYNKFTANFEAGSGHAGLAQPLKGANFDLLAEQIRELAAGHGEPCRVIITEWGDYSKFSQVSRLEDGQWTEWEKMR